MPDFTEEGLEQSTIDIFVDLGWQWKDCYEETFGDSGTLGRKTPADVVLISRLLPILRKFNPDLPQEAYDQAVAELIRYRSTSIFSANQEIYKLLKDGVKVEYLGQDGHRMHGNVKIVDWRNPKNNDYFLAKQFWISGTMYKRRADLVGFINGIPLVFIELKAAHQRIQDSFRNNLKDYKETIPQAFWYNAFIILSNGSEAKIGSITAPWEFFNDWKRLNDEKEQGVIDLDTMIRGTCEPEKLLDIVENFILFTQLGGAPVKIIPKNHQFLGVNNVYRKFFDLKKLDGKLGVFWHTQGSGKSVSIMALAQKVLRTIEGKWTFLIVSDRNDLDDQIYKNFADAGVVSEPFNRVRADNGNDLKRKLSQEDHRYIFTTIQKFYTPIGTKYPELSTRSDLIVITDEAHRSEYGTLAENMRSALPKAAFIGFTGTPLIGLSDEKTKEWFGDYVSVYDFKQSIEDHATVPLYYDNRLKKLMFKDKEIFEKEMLALIEKADLDDDQEEKLEREYAQNKQLIIREDRLEAVAKDIVNHFMGRGFMGKAMVVSIDKVTAVKMYDKVQKYWKQYKEDLRQKAEHADEHKQEEISKTISYMERVDMAVVVTGEQNEVEKMRKKGVDIIPHRERMNREDLAAKFKDPVDPFQIVFLCAMWFTGFDVPHCSTLYLDKPLKNHTLMQTIARANRVYPGKSAGLICDYVSIFRNLKKALSIYAVGRGLEGCGVLPIEDKEKLIEELRNSARINEKFLTQIGVSLEKMKNADVPHLVKMLGEAVDAIVQNEQRKSEYIANYNWFSRVFKAILPDTVAHEFSDLAGILRAISRKIQSLEPEVNIDEVRGRIEELLDRSILPESYVLKDPEGVYNPIDISQMDFEKLRTDFEKAQKHIEIERLKNGIHSKLDDLLQKNRSRIDWKEKFDQLINEYNSGRIESLSFFDQLTKLGEGLSKEEKRHVMEGVSEEELAVYDLLTKPAVILSEEEKLIVKKVSKRLLEHLKKNDLVLDWRYGEQNRARVKVAIAEELEQLPHDSFPKVVFRQKCEQVFMHIYDSYWGSGKSVYSLNAFN